MGDRAYLHLNVWEDRAPVHNPGWVIQRLRRLYPEFKVFADDGDTKDECNLDYEEPLIEFSRKNPTMLFCMYVESTSGVGVDSVWRDYFKNGKMCNITPIWPEFTESMLQ